VIEEASDPAEISIDVIGWVPVFTISALIEMPGTPFEVQDEPTVCVICAEQPEFEFPEVLLEEEDTLPEVEDDEPREGHDSMLTVA